MSKKIRIINWDFEDSMPCLGLAVEDRNLCDESKGPKFCVHCMELAIEYDFRYLKSLIWDIAELRGEESDLAMCHASDGEDTEEIERLIRRKNFIKRELHELGQRYTELTGYVKVSFRDDGGIKLFSPARKA